MDDINILIRGWKELSPWAMLAFLVGLALWKLTPYFQKRVELETVKVKGADDIVEKSLTLLNTFQQSLEAQERRNEERFKQSMETMLAVRDKREALIVDLEQDIKDVPLQVLDAQRPTYEAQAAAIENVQRSLAELKLELVSRLSILEQRIPESFKKLMHENMSVIVSKFDAVIGAVKREGTNDGNLAEQGRVESAADGDPAGSADPAGDPLRGAQSTDGTAEGGGNDSAAADDHAEGSGSAERSDQPDALGTGETTPN